MAVERRVWVRTLGATTGVLPAAQRTPDPKPPFFSTVLDGAQLILVGSRLPAGKVRQPTSWAILTGSYATATGRAMSRYRRSDAARGVMNERNSLHAVCACD